MEDVNQISIKQDQLNVRFGLISILALSAMDIKLNQTITSDSKISSKNVVNSDINKFSDLEMESNVCVAEKSEVTEPSEIFITIFYIYELRKTSNANDLRSILKNSNRQNLNFKIHWLQ